MILPKVSDILGIINKIAPFGLAEGWDNVGLQVGDPSWAAARIMIALDPCQDAVNAAVQEGCHLLLTHHPLLFTPPKKMTLSDPVGRVVAAAFKNDLAIVSLHTNYDIAEGGINDLLAERIGLGRCEPLKLTASEELVKLVVFVPKGHEDKVMECLFRFSGFIGNYSDCSFGVEGTGTFRPLSGSRPFLGEVGKRECVEELRVEVLLQRSDVAAAVNAMIKAHPYEEPAFDLYPLLNKGKSRGLGRIGRLSEAVPLAHFAKDVMARLELSGGRFVGDPEHVVRKVALCGGSGMSLLREAHFQGADVFVTGDVKYHEAREAEALGIGLVDAGHFGTEQLMVQGVTGLLREELANRKLKATIIPFKGERDPFTIVARN